MTPIPPPLLAGFDWGALWWAAFWALVFSLSTLRQRFDAAAATGKTPPSWWAIVLETVLGGLVGGVLLATAVPERWPEFRSPGLRMVLAAAGASVGPFLGLWGPQIMAALAKRQFGVTLTVQEQPPKKRGGDDGEKDA